MSHSGTTTTPPPSAWGSAFARFRSPILCTLWIAAFVCFHVWNLTHYDPIRGYDGLHHMRVLASYHETGGPPVSGYGSNNPPLYYMLTGGLWGWTKSLKVLQLFSLLLYGVNVWLMKRLLWSATSNSWTRWAALSFVAFVPVHIAYAYMIFNYALAHTLELAAVFCLYRFVQAHRPRMIAAAGVLAALTISTALTGLYLVPLGVFTAFTFAKRMFARRLLYVGIFIFAVAVVSTPLYFYPRRAHACFLCTVNRSPTKKPLTSVYPPSFYVRFSPTALLKPYYPNNFFGGLWNLVYETAFGDYFGYLVPDRLTDWGVKDRTGLISTGRHFLDAARARQLAILNLLGLPVALALLAAFVNSARKTLLWLRHLRTAPPPISTFVLATALLSFAQFFAYILRYPDYVNIHAGYILIIFLIGTVELAGLLRARWSRLATNLSLTIYSIWAYWLFFLR